MQDDSVDIAAEKVIQRHIARREAGHLKFLAGKFAKRSGSLGSILSDAIEESADQTVYLEYLRQQVLDNEDTMDGLRWRIAAIIEERDALRETVDSLRKLLQE